MSLEVPREDSAQLPRSRIGLTMSQLPSLQQFSDGQYLGRVSCGAGVCEYEFMEEAANGIMIVTMGHGQLLLSCPSLNSFTTVHTLS